MNQANARQIDQNTVWSVNADNVSKVRTLDIWLTHIKGSHEYEQLQRKYYRSYNPHKKAEKGIKVSHVSPYDSIIKKYAKELGWDWRMLAAVVYQESKFSINSVSHRGARGLMQVMPKTAQYYGIEDLNDPDQNLKAGTSHLLRLQNMYAKSGMDKTEMIKFTLAAYNAGEGRIADCRNFAASKGIDKNSWDEIVSLIPLMREDSILEEKSVKLGKFKGHETIAYVNNVMSLYESFCTIHPSI
jgi:membrane-bound lytic murein transglycosylase F